MGVSAEHMVMMQAGLSDRSRSDSHDEDDVCFYNIGPQQRRMRMIFGLVTLAVGLVIGVGLIVLDAAIGWRLALALVFITAGTGIFQAREKT